MLTFKETIFIVYYGDLLLFQTGSPVHFTVVFIEFSIRGTHRFVMWFAVLHAQTLGLASLAIHNAVSAQTTVFVLT